MQLSPLATDCCAWRKFVVICSATKMIIIMTCRFYAWLHCRKLCSETSIMWQYFHFLSQMLNRICLWYLFLHLCCYPVWESPFSRCCPYLKQLQSWLWQARCVINRKTLFIANKQCFSIEKHCFSLEKHSLLRKTKFIKWKAEFLKNIVFQIEKHSFSSW